jgi:hypothetical protein
VRETNTTMFPPGRYGRRREPGRARRLRRLATVAALLVVVVIGSAMAYSLGQRYGPGRPYDVTVERFYDITDHQVVVEFTVHVPAGGQAVCAVRARSEDGAEVGRDEVRVTPAEGETRPRVTHRLTTTDRPVTGEVQRCWAAD